MSQSEGRFLSSDGLSLYRRTWVPEVTPRGAVVLLHGFTEHSGRYGELAERLNREGYAVYAMDLRGHGQSQGEPAWVDDFGRYVADLRQFVALVRGEAGGGPLFLLGHSMGGTIILHTAARGSIQADGLALSAPAVQIGPRVFPVLRLVAHLAGRVLPTLRLVRLGAHYISRDPAVAADFAQDPLVFHGRFPIRTGAEILAAARQLGHTVQLIRTPLLILQGTGDLVVNPKGAELLLQQAASADKVLRLYPRLYHDLFHEPEKDQVTADLIAWLQSRS